MFIPEVNFSFYQYGMLLSLTWREALSQTVSVFIYVEARSHKKSQSSQLKQNWQKWVILTDSFLSIIVLFKHFLDFIEIRTYTLE